MEYRTKLAEIQCNDNFSSILCDIQHLDEREESVVVGEEHISCEYLLGCDGAHSPIRHELGFPQEVHESLAFVSRLSPLASRLSLSLSLSRTHASAQSPPRLTACTGRGHSSDLDTRRFELEVPQLRDPARARRARFLRAPWPCGHCSLFVVHAHTAVA